MNVYRDFAPKAHFGHLGAFGVNFGYPFGSILHLFRMPSLDHFWRAVFCDHFTYAFIQILLPKLVLAAWTLLGGLRWGPLAHEIRIIAAFS